MTPIRPDRIRHEKAGSPIRHSASRVRGPKVGRAQWPSGQDQEFEDHGGFWDVAPFGKAPFFFARLEETCGCEQITTTLSLKAKNSMRVGCAADQTKGKDVPDRVRASAGTWPP